MEPLLEDAYALQVEYDTEQPDPETIKAKLQKLKIKAISEDRKCWEHKIRTKRRSNRPIVCNEPVTLITRKDIDLMSNAQLVYFPILTKETTIYYPLDAVTDVEALLQLRRNPYTNEALTATQITFLEAAKQNHKYPRIAVGDFFEEVDERLNCKPLEYREKEYQRKMRELVALIEGTEFIIYEIAGIYTFATDYNHSQYNLFLRHKPLSQKLEPCSRDDASSQTLNCILNYLNIQKQQGNTVIAITDMAYAIDEFIYMIRNSLTYEELLRDRNIANELHWKPNFVQETHYNNGNVKCQYFTDEYDIKHGSYSEWYSNGNLAYQSTFVHGVETGIVRYYGTGEKAFEHNIYSYMNGTVLARLNGDQYDIFDDVGNHLGFGDLSINGGFIEFKNNGMMLGARLEMYGNLIISIVIYQNNLKHGVAIKWYQSGHLLSRLEFVDGNTHGIAEQYHENGRLQVRRAYQLGTPIDEYEQYRDNGVLQSKGCFDAGGKYGFWNVWDNKGQLSEEGFYINGLLNGLYRTWQTGILKCEYYYLDGKKVGSWKDWFFNGLLYKYRSYINDLLEGKYYEYHATGQLDEKRFYIQGKLHGSYKTYNPNGSLRSHQYYLNGEKDGPQLYYHSNGRIRSKEQYENKICVVYQAWHTNGQKTTERYFDDGKQIGIERIWNDTGLLGLEGFKYEGKYYGLFQEWDHKGTLITHGLYLDDKRTGSWMFLEGGIWHRGEYNEGKKTGVWCQFIGTQLIYEETYCDGMPHGPKIKYYPNGVVMFTGDYDMNNPTGPWKYYYPNGQIAGSGNYCYKTPRFSVWDPYGTYIGERFVQRVDGLGFHTEDKKTDGYSLKTVNGLPHVMYYRMDVKQPYEVQWKWDGDQVVCVMTN